MRAPLQGQFRSLVRGGTALEKAVRWVKRKRQPGSGIVAHHKTTTVTPEVTGYLIPSLYRAGEKGLAYDLARWEASIQRPDGAFNGPGSDVPYCFDTAQVVRGFLSVLNDLPELEGNVRRACDYLVGQIDETGEVHTPSYAAWSLPDGSRFSTYCNLYALPPLLEAGKRLRERQYIETALRSLRFFKGKTDLAEFKSELGTLSHIFGYMMEALVELEEVELARRGLQQAQAIQKEDGAIPAYPGVDWVCSTGMAQLGLAWAKVGERPLAEKVLQYLERIQHPSGGFYGSYGKGAEYFPAEEISWANKFFIDLSLSVRGRHG